MDENTFYIWPEIVNTRDEKENHDFSDWDPMGFEEWIPANENKAKEESETSILDEIYSNDFSIVISEPGYGKTRFLKEIAINGSEQNLECCFIDLKKLYKESIKDAIERIEKRGKATKNNELLENDVFITNKFKSSINDESQIILLDALDEVSKQKQFEIIEKIKDFKADNPDFKVILSCRGYVYNELKNHFNDVEFESYRIKGFKPFQITEFLRKSGLNEEERNGVIKKFNYGFQTTFLETPRFLAILGELIKSTGFEEVINSSITEIYDKIIYEKLEVEGEKIGKNQATLIKRVLEKLSLISEIYQKNQVGYDELMTFFDDIKSNLGVSFLQQVSLQELYNRTVLISDNYEQEIKFENKEFQEYLAAKELARISRPDQVVYDLAYDSDLKEFYTSWYNTLSFFTKLKPSVISYMTSFIAKRKKSNDENLIDYILPEEQTIIDELSEKEKASIFRDIFSYFQDSYYEQRGLLIQHNTAKNLARFFSNENEALLKNWIQEGVANRKIQHANVINVIRFLIKPGKVDLPYWKDQLSQRISNKNEEDLPMKDALLALGEFEDISLFEKYYNPAIHDQREIFDDFVRGCIRADPNSLYTIQKIVEGHRDKKFRIAPEPFFHTVTTSKGIKNVIDYIRNNELLRERITDYSSYHKTELNAFFRKIESYYNVDVKNSLFALYRDAEDLVSTDNFLKEIGKILKKQNPEFILDYIDQIQNLTSIETEKIENLLTPPFVSKMIDDLKNRGVSEDKITEIFVRFIDSSGEEDNKIEANAREKLNQQINEFLQYREEFQDQHNRNLQNRFVNNFRRKLREFKQGGKEYNLFRMFNQNKDSLLKELKKEQVEELKQVAEEVINKRELNYENDTSLKNELITNAILSLLKLEKDSLSKEQRQEIFKALVFWNVGLDFPKIFKLLGKPEEDEIQYLEQLAKDKQGVINYGILIQLADRFKIHSFLPLLKREFNSGNLNESEMLKLLQIIDKLEPDFHFFKEVFEDRSNFEAITLKANEYLIENGNKGDFETYRKAVEWRVNKIKSMEEPYEANPLGIYDHQEVQHQNKNLNKPLIELSDSRFIDVFLDLLKTGLKAHLNRRRYSYADYIFKTVFVYFDNLKSEISLEPLRKVEAVVQQYDEIQRISYNYLKNLRITYLEVKKPTSIEESIKQYNAIKETQYLTIATRDELIFKLREILEGEIRSWAENEGTLNKIAKAKGEQEKLIQKTMQPKLEKELMVHGFRNNDWTVYREVEKGDEKKIDFIIGYGLIGQVILELKRTDNPEASNESKRESYKKKLVSGYLEGMNADYLFYVLFHIKNEPNYDSILEKHNLLYEDKEEIEVIGYNCILSN